MNSLKKAFSYSVSVKDGHDQEAGDSRKNKYIKPEDLLLRKGYAFSFNPVQQPELKDPVGQKLWFKDMVEYFTSLRYCRVHLYVEFSQMGRFHFHGYIWVNDHQFYLYDVPRMNFWGSCEMDTIGDPAWWVHYYMKSQLFIQHMLKREFQPKIIDPKKNHYQDLFYTITT